MREIKFRCWNKDIKSFHYWGVGIEGCTFIGPPVGKQPANKYEHQQFTGLHDKNGKEIYEGDIIVCIYGKHYNEQQGLKKICQVTYNNATASFVAVPYGSKVKVNFYDVVKQSVEIIGNIYENKELIT